MAINFDDSTSYNQSIIDLKELGEVPYEDTSFKVGFMITNGFIITKPYDDEVKKHLTIDFVEFE